MMDDEDLFELIKSQGLPELNQDQSEEELIDFMSQRIEALLAGDFEALMSMMYRLDVDEAKIRKALAPHNPENPARSLARLIVQRQMKRMATREKYKRDAGEWIDIE
ncbi:MAG: hypothetical protein KDC53_08645 [Saprospiraceae bacterium]|nr:hypothetical protein [Saprospiraceae bacterium]